MWRWVDYRGNKTYTKGFKIVQHLKKEVIAKVENLFKKQLISFFFNVIIVL